MKNLFNSVITGVLIALGIIVGFQVSGNQLARMFDTRIVSLMQQSKTSEVYKPLGSSGDTFSTQKKAQIVGTTLISTSSLLNDDTQPRQINRLYGILSTTPGAPVTSIHFAYSTNTAGTGTLIDLGVSTSIANNAATSFNSSTISPATLGNWSTSSYKYLICYTLQPVSTTVSFCGAEYDNY